jgi:predicted nucleic acid-binding protein
LILYLDTSALVKLYVSEPGSPAVRRLAARSAALATSALAYAEARSAFARLRRSGLTSDRQHARRLARFDRDWEDYVRVELSAEVLRDSGTQTERFALRGFDSIHLASALWLRGHVSSPLVFAAYDERLRAGAEQAGLALYPTARKRARASAR